MKPNLEVERVVLGQMPRTRVRFGTIHMAGLEHLLECGDAVLFVELRTLREIRDTIEVVDGEEVGTAFGAGRDDLRRNDLGESMLDQVFPEIAQQRALNAKHVADCFVARRERPVLEPRVNADARNVARCVERQLVRCRIQYADVRHVDLDAELRARIGAHRTDHFDRVVEFQVQRTQRVRRADALHFAARVAQDHERRAGEYAQAKNPTAQYNGLTEVLGDRTRLRCGTETSIPWQLSIVVGKLLEPVVGGAIQLPAQGRHSMRCVVAIRLFLLGPAGALPVRKSLSEGSVLVSEWRGCYAFGCGAAICPLPDGPGMNRFCELLFRYPQSAGNRCRMNFLIGFVVVMGCVLGGFVISGGHVLARRSMARGLPRGGRPRLVGAVRQRRPAEPGQPSHLDDRAEQEGRRSADAGKTGPALEAPVAPARRAPKDVVPAITPVLGSDTRTRPE